MESRLVRRHTQARMKSEDAQKEGTSAAAHSGPGGGATRYGPGRLSQQPGAPAAGGGEDIGMRRRQTLKRAQQAAAAGAGVDPTSSAVGGFQAPPPAGPVDIPPHAQPYPPRVQSSYYPPPSTSLGPGAFRPPGRLSSPRPSPGPGPGPQQFAPAPATRYTLSDAPSVAASSDSGYASGPPGPPSGPQSSGFTYTRPSKAAQQQAQPQVQPQQPSGPQTFAGANLCSGCLRLDSS
jgi:hypothetical protein